MAPSRTKLLAALAAGSIAALTGPPARAHLAVEPLREVLRGASRDVAACAAAHDLPRGRYAVRLLVLPTGKVEDFEVDAAPEDLGRPAASCLEAAFTRLRFPGRVPAARPARAGGREPASHLPPERRRDRTVEIHWPFVLVAPGRGPGK